MRDFFLRLVHVDRDYFSFFGIEPQLALDPVSLQKRFYELSRQWHPDRFAARPAVEQQQALENTALLNDAFRTLKQPVSRAEYVLSRHGLATEDAASKNVPPELLEEVFEMNMALDELKDGDASVRPQLESARAGFASTLAEIDAQLEAQFRGWDESRSDEVLSQVRALLNKRKYIHNLVNTVDQALG
jgi:molecular chaperone HscB